MGEKYTSQTLSGYNATPPADDGTETEANKGYWATIKTKLGDPLRDYADDINTAMETFADYGPITKSAAYTTTTAEHLQTIECTGTFILTLGASATMGAGYIVTIKNVGTGIITVDGSGAETIDGQDDIPLDPLQGVTVQVDNTGTEYLNIAQKNPQFYTPAVTGGSANTYTVTTGETAYLADKLYMIQIHASNTGASTIDFDSLGAKDIKDLAGSDPEGNMLRTGQVVNLLYDGTNMVITSYAQPVHDKAIKNAMIRDAVTGAQIAAASDAEETTTTLSMVKIKEIYVPYGGTFSVYFELKTDNPSWNVYGQIYVNGSPIGTLRTRIGTTAYLDFTEDITVNPSDLIQLYGYRVSPATCFVKNFRVREDAPLVFYTNS
jgi:hypothetical protein